VQREVAANVRPSTPDPIFSYVYFQRWRVLQNWSIVIGKIQGDAEARQAARARAGKRLATRLGDEAKRMEDVIPAGEPIRYVVAP
jgi:hypothetical protein